MGRKQVEEFLNVVGIIFPIKHWNCADNQNDSGLLAESSFQWNTRIILQVNCFVLRSTKQFTYRMILVFHWNDDSAKRPELFGLLVSKQHNSNVLLERWYQHHLGILQLFWAQNFVKLHNSDVISSNNKRLERPDFENC